MLSDAEGLRERRWAARARARAQASSETMKVLAALGTDAAKAGKWPSMGRGVHMCAKDPKKEHALSLHLTSTRRGTWPMHAMLEACSYVMADQRIGGS